jgi:sugar phosphate isomerase/epimerase
MISYQIYSSRNFPPLSATLKMLGEAGYEGIEGFGGLFGTQAAVDELAAGLKANGLAMPTTHIGLEMLETQPDYVLGIAQQLGWKKAYVPHVMADQRPNDAAGWRAFGARLQKAGAPLRAAGIGFGWHNHDFEFVVCADGAIPQAAILEGGPDLEWEIDLAWVVRGGQEPLDWIERFKSRITAAHVKDLAPEGENADESGWADVGHGRLPLASYVQALRLHGVSNFVLEHDNPSDDKRFATRALASAKTY